MLESETLRHLGGALQALREAAGLTQAKVATRCENVYPPQISRYERGHEEPALATLVKILAALEADFTDLQAELDRRASGVEPPAATELDTLRRETLRRLPDDPYLRQLLAEMVEPVLDEVAELRARVDEIEHRGDDGDDD